MSTTVAPPAKTEAPAETPGQTGRGRRVLNACAGPALIVVSVVVALRGFIFTPSITNQHPDILSFWLPRFAFLGRSLAAGHVPLWNPYEFTGARFAADPQGGWLYLPAMKLFSWVNPGTAMRAFIALNSLLSGIGIDVIL